MNQLTAMIVIALTFLLFSAVQLYASFVGISFYCGGFIAIIFIIFALTLRFPLPITISAFFGAIKVWHWHWFFALLFVSPGFALIVPGALMAIISKLTNSSNLADKTFYSSKTFFFTNKKFYSNPSESSEEESSRPMIVINPKDNPDKKNS